MSAIQMKIIERDAFKILGKTKTITVVDGENQVEIPKFWEEVWTDGTADELKPMISGVFASFIGVCAGTEAEMQKGIMHYTIGVESDETTPAFTTIDIPSAKWAVFEVIGAMPDAIQEMWQQIYTEWIPQGEYQLRDDIPELEVYSDDNDSDAEYESEIWIAIQ